DRRIVTPEVSFHDRRTAHVNAADTAFAEHAAGVAANLDSEIGKRLARADPFRAARVGRVTTAHTGRVAAARTGRVPPAHIGRVAAARNGRGDAAPQAVRVDGKTFPATTGPREGHGQRRFRQT